MVTIIECTTFWYSGHSLTITVTMFNLGCWWTQVSNSIEMKNSEDLSIHIPMDLPMDHDDHDDLLTMELDSRRRTRDGDSSQVPFRRPPALGSEPRVVQGSSSLEKYDIILESSCINMFAYYSKLILQLIYSIINIVDSDMCMWFYFANNDQ